jgi:hypothetical protein
MKFLLMPSGWLLGAVFPSFMGIGDVYYDRKYLEYFENIRS